MREVLVKLGIEAVSPGWNSEDESGLGIAGVTDVYLTTKAVGITEVALKEGHIGMRMNE